MVAIMKRGKQGKNYLFLTLNIETEDLNTIKLDSKFLIILYHLERYVYVTTVLWLHRENKMY